MKITLSRSQWERIGKKAGWNKTAVLTGFTGNQPQGTGATTVGLPGANPAPAAPQGAMSLEQVKERCLQQAKKGDLLGAVVDFQKLAPKETTQHPMFNMLMMDAMGKANKQDSDGVIKFISGF